MINRTKRYIAGILVHEASAALVHSQHLLHRGFKVYQGGLTPKEVALLQKKAKEIEEIQILVSKVANRLIQSGKCT